MCNKKRISVFCFYFTSLLLYLIFNNIINLQFYYELQPTLLFLVAWATLGNCYTSWYKTQKRSESVFVEENLLLNDIELCRRLTACACIGYKFITRGTQVAKDYNNGKSQYCWDNNLWLSPWLTGTVKMKGLRYH